MIRQKCQFSLPCKIIVTFITPWGGRKAKVTNSIEKTYGHVTQIPAEGIV